MNMNILRGQLVRLSAEDPAIMAKAMEKWGRDSEYLLLEDSDPAILWSAKKTKEWIEKRMEEQESSEFEFAIRTLQDDILIGFVGLFVDAWNHAEGWVGIGLGDRAYWNNGYGTEAMQLILHYGFTELNLHRVSLNVFDYNPRAIRSYEKAGFILEGRLREEVVRQGKRWDTLVMGILRKEWEQNQRA